MATHVPAGDSMTEGFAAFGPPSVSPRGTPDGPVGWRGRFSSPRTLLQARRIEDVVPLVEAADAAARQGAWAVLVLAYEAAPAFDAALKVRESATADVPLAWAAVYDDGPVHAAQGGVQAPGVGSAPQVAQAVRLAPWDVSLDAPTFAARLRTLQAHIAAGDTYQVNFTFPLTTRLPLEHAWAWYVQACRRAQAPYAACIDMGAHVVLSLSPELFLSRQGTRVVARPMKGTAARGRWPEEDVTLREGLRTSEKARAENVMIVDLLRNDLGRIARLGSVRVTDLCAVEAYPTVWQMTSTIEADVAPTRGLADVLRAVFPCGSITGAPKVRTMDLIAATEVAPRGVYTGAIGLLRPGGDMVMSVPIRTVVVERATEVATLGVGAGITADSVAADEYAECLLKAAFADPAPEDEVTGLFETLCLEEGRLWLRARHLRRLMDSAVLCGIAHDTSALVSALDEAASTRPHGRWRVRLTLSAEGSVMCDVAPLVPWPAPRRLALAAAPTPPSDRRRFLKTVDRSLYDAALAEHPEADDVLLWNGKGELTESCVANVVLDLGGRLWTPPVSCGLLPGTLRGALLEAGVIAERVLTCEDLARADAVWLINSLRGWVAVEPVR